MNVFGIPFGKIFKDGEKIQTAPIEKIRQSPYKPIRMNDNEAIYELSRSIRLYGVLQPLLVREAKNGYELISGSRRLRAAKIAGLESVPIFALDVSESEGAAISVAENIQTKRPDFFEEADAIESVMDFYGVTESQLAEKLCKSETYIINRLRLLKLPTEVKRIVIENQLSEKHALALAKIPDNAVMAETAKNIAENGLNITAAQKLIEEKMDAIRNKQTALPSVRRETIKISDMRLFTNSIKQSLDLAEKTGFKTEYDAKNDDGLCEIHIKIQSNKCINNPL